MTTNQETVEGVPYQVPLYEKVKPMYDAADEVAKRHGYQRSELGTITAMYSMLGMVFHLPETDPDNPQARHRILRTVTETNPKLRALFDDFEVAANQCGFSLKNEGLATEDHSALWLDFVAGPLLDAELMAQWRSGFRYAQPNTN